MRPLKDSRASLSFFKRTCPSKEAVSRSLASSDSLAAEAKFLSNLLARSLTERRLCCSASWAVSWATTSLRGGESGLGLGSSTISLLGPILYFGNPFAGKLTSAETDSTLSTCTSNSTSGLTLVIVNQAELSAQCR
uniref:Uncharacterized protein n=1 Tax=Opuntia streptacantha TaxID=393608 RepID=A0A7C9CGI8_OPUST